MREDEPAPDGGQPEFDLFTRTADSPAFSRRQRLRRWFDAYLGTPLRIAWNDWRARFGGLIVLFFVLMGTVGPMLVPEPRTLQGPVFLGPFDSSQMITLFDLNAIGIDFAFRVWEFPLGTNISGKGVLRQTVHTTTPMLKMILAGAVLSVVLGALIGALAGYKSGTVDNVLMIVTDVALTVPGLALVIVIAAVWDPSNPYIVGIILGIDNWPGLARTIRSQVLSIREEDFVEASRTLGLSSRRVMRKDLLSPLMPYISINVANSARRIIFESVALYFLGILSFADPNWGVMMQRAYNQINLRSTSQLHWMLVPMLAIAFLSLGFVLFSQGLDRVFNVRLRARHSQTKGGESEAAEVSE